MAARKIAVEAVATIFTAPGVAHARGSVLTLDAATASGLIASGMARAAPVAPARSAPATAETVDGAPETDGGEEDRE